MTRMVRVFDHGTTDKALELPLTFSQAVEKYTAMGFRVLMTGVQSCFLYHSFGSDLYKLEAE